jgi:phage antirepressor YoqD-like protein
MKEDANNYGPITLVRALSKILEKITANQLIYFLEKHNMVIKS